MAALVICFGLRMKEKNLTHCQNGVKSGLDLPFAGGESAQGSFQDETAKFKEWASAIFEGIRCAIDSRMQMPGWLTPQ